MVGWGSTGGSPWERVPHRCAAESPALVRVQLTGRRWVGAGLRQDGDGGGESGGGRSRATGERQSSRVSGCWCGYGRRSGAQAQTGKIQVKPHATRPLANDPTHARATPDPTLPAPGGSNPPTPLGSPPVHGREPAAPIPPGSIEVRAPPALWRSVGTVSRNMYGVPSPCHLEPPWALCVLG